MKCINCNSVIPDDSEFCPKCGDKINLQNSTFCRECGKEIGSDSGFCRYCGKAIVQTNIDIPMLVCETCKKPLNPEWDECPNCSTTRLSNTIDDTPSKETHREAKKKLTKKIIGIASAFVATVAIASILIVPQYYSDFEVSNLEDGTLAISGYHGDGGDIVIPEKLHFKTVTAIGSDAFNNNDNITEVVLPNTIESIDTSAFFDCDKLFRVVMTDSVDYIGKTAFADCDNLVTLMGYSKSIDDKPRQTSLRLNTIDDGCFSECRKLVDIVQADNIGAGAYGNCTNLKGRLKINAVKIGVAAFSQCTGITSVEIVADEIESAAFELCKNLKFKSINPHSASQPQVASDAFTGCNLSRYNKVVFNEITDTSSDLNIQTVEETINRMHSLGKSAVDIIGKTNDEAFEYLVDNYSKQNCEWGGKMYYSNASKIAFVQSNYTGIIDKVIVYSGGCVNWEISPNMTYRKLFEVLGEQMIIQDDIGKFGFSCKYGNCILSFVGSSDSLDSSPEICYVCLA